MLKMVRKQHRFSCVAKAAALVAAAALLGSVNAAAQQPLAAPVAAATGFPMVKDTHADLERAFWVCDHAATTAGVGLATAVACVTVSEAFKKARFDGDLDAMLTWWRQHKPAAHKAVETARSERGFAEWTALPRC